MDKQKYYASYASEINEIESLLAIIPPENILERNGLKARLNRARTILKSYDQPAHENK